MSRSPDAALEQKRRTGNWSSERNGRVERDTKVSGRLSGRYRNIYDKLQFFQTTTIAFNFLTAILEINLEGILGLEINRKRE